MTRNVSLSFSIIGGGIRLGGGGTTSVGLPIKQTRDQIGAVPTQRERDRDSLNSRAMNADKKAGSTRPAEEEGPTTRQRNNRIHALCISDIRAPLSSKHKGSYFWLYADPYETFPLQTKCRLVRQPLWHRPAAATGKSHGKIYGDILYPLSDFKYIIQRRRGEWEREGWGESGSRDRFKPKLL